MGQITQVHETQKKNFEFHHCRKFVLCHPCVSMYFPLAHLTTVHRPHFSIGESQVGMIPLKSLPRFCFVIPRLFTISIKYFPQDTMFFHCFLPFWASFTSSHALTTALIETSSTCNPWASKSHNNCTATCHSPLLLQASKTLFKVIRSLQWNLVWKLFWRDGIW